MESSTSIHFEYEKNTVFTDVTEDIHQHLIGKFHAIEDGVEVLPVSEEIKCYEERFKAVRNKEKTVIIM